MGLVSDEMVAWVRHDPQASLRGMTVARGQGSPDDTLALGSVTDLDLAQQAQLAVTGSVRRSVVQVAMLDKHQEKGTVGMPAQGTVRIANALPPPASDQQE